MGNHEQMTVSSADPDRRFSGKNCRDLKHLKKRGRSVEIPIGFCTAPSTQAIIETDSKSVRVGMHVPGPGIEELNGIDS